jgi:acetyltransferase-like isoleucine patch superfamily enzyme
MSFISQNKLDEMGFKSLGKNVLISDKCSLYNIKNISIGDNTRIDDFCILSAGDEGIEIGKYVHIACYSSLIGKGKITMKDYSGISSRVSVYSSSDNYDGEYMTNPCLPDTLTNTIHKDVIIGKHVVIGSNSVVLPGVILTDGCSVGAMSLVNKSIDGPYVMAGIPIKKIKKRKSKIFDLEKNIK